MGSYQRWLAARCDACVIGLPLPLITHTHSIPIKYPHHQHTPQITPNTLQPSTTRCPLSPPHLPSTTPNPSRTMSPFTNTHTPCKPINTPMESTHSAPSTSSTQPPTHPLSTHTQHAHSNTPPFISPSPIKPPSPLTLTPSPSAPLDPPTSTPYPSHLPPQPLRISTNHHKPSPLQITHTKPPQQPEQQQQL